MNTKRIDSINIFLMIASMCVAMFFPFELFLFVYAILGPLHYLTEINWLHQKRFFLKKYNDIYWIVFIIFLLALKFIFHLKWASSILLYAAFWGSFCLLAFTSKIKAALSFIIGMCVGLVLYYFELKSFRLVFSIFLPSILHVFIFTGFFILLGALKSKSKTGIASVVVFIACAILLLWVSTGFYNRIVNSDLMNNYSTFRSINLGLKAVFDFLHFPAVVEAQSISGTHSLNDQMVYFSDIGVKIMRFIAFAYTYHYLNWFSKTSVIQWHKTSKLLLVSIFIIWFMSVGLYIYDYAIGLQWLYLLSISHVILEFPLNHKSFIDVKNHLKSSFHN